MQSHVVGNYPSHRKVHKQKLTLVGVSVVFSSATTVRNQSRTAAVNRMRRIVLSMAYGLLQLMVPLPMWTYDMVHDSHFFGVTNGLESTGLERIG